MVYKLICFFAGHKPYYMEVSVTKSSRQGNELASKRTRQIAADHCTRCTKPQSAMTEKEINKIVTHESTNIIKSFEDHLRSK